MSEEQLRLRKDQDSRDVDTNRSIRTTLISLFLFAVLVGFNIWYTNYINHKNDQRWCEIFVGLDDNYRAAQPGALEPRQQKFADQVHRLRVGLECAATPVPVPSPTPSSAGAPTPTDQPTAGTGTGG